MQIYSILSLQLTNGIYLNLNRVHLDYNAGMILDT